MSQQFKTKEFLELQAKWYEKLKKDKFNDIERNETTLHLSHAGYFSDLRKNPNHPDVIEAKQNYYRLAGQFTHEHKFKSRRQKRIWQLHADGKSVRQIAEILKKQGVLESKKSAVFDAIKAVESEMINKWIKKT